LEIEDQRREQAEELSSKPEPTMAFRVKGGGALVVQVQLADEIAGIDHGAIHEHEALPTVAGHPQPQDVPTQADRANVFVTLDPTVQPTQELPLMRAASPEQRSPLGRSRRRGRNHPTFVVVSDAVLHTTRIADPLILDTMGHLGAFG
jgi:hypothetical protein